MYSSTTLKNVNSASKSLRESKKGKNEKRKGRLSLEYLWKKGKEK